MEEKIITMTDMIVKIIKENQITPGDEDLIRDLLEGRKRERDERRVCRCLAEYVEKEMDILLSCHEKDNKEKCSRLSRMCFRESRIGNRDIREVSASDIRKLIILTEEMNRIGSRDRMFFMMVLQHTLKELDRKGILNFTPPKKIFSDYKAAMDRVTFIDNPYTLEEEHKIMEWINASQHDMRGLAVGMWLASDITAEEIVGLKKENLMDSDGIYSENPTVLKKNGIEDYLAIDGRRGKLIRDALNIHAGRDLEYIFMSGDNEGVWRKMPSRSLPLKMSFICREIGIAYKPFKCTDAIKWHDGLIY